jgi:hypothetical protein
LNGRESKMSKQDVVFTSLFGQYEDLNELHITKSRKTKYVCFTDDPLLESDTWEIKLVKTTDPANPSRNSREIKMLGHKYFPTGTRSLYVDNTVRLKVDGSIILDAWLSTADIAFMRHYSRKTLQGEFFVCSAYGLDHQDMIWEQFKYYREHFKGVLKERPHWGGMIARVNSPSTDEFMEIWKQQFDNFTKRDQLSINVSSIISGVSIDTIIGENDSTEWHEWPIHSNRKTTMRDTTSGRNFRKFRIIYNALRYGYRFYVPDKIWHRRIK